MRLQFAVTQMYASQMITENFGAPCHRNTLYKSKYRLFRSNPVQVIAVTCFTTTRAPERCQTTAILQIYFDENPENFEANRNMAHQSRYPFLCSIIRKTRYREHNMNWRYAILCIMQKGKTFITFDQMKRSNGEQSISSAIFTNLRDW